MKINNAQQWYFVYLSLQLRTLQQRLKFMDDFGRLQFTAFREQYLHMCEAYVKSAIRPRERFVAYYGWPAPYLHRYEEGLVCGNCGAHSFTSNPEYIEHLMGGNCLAEYCQKELKREKKRKEAEEQAKKQIEEGNKTDENAPELLTGSVIVGPQPDPEESL